MKLFLLTGLLMANNMVFAAGKGTGSPADLIPAFINLFILLSFLIWILKSPHRTTTEKNLMGLKTYLRGQV